MRKIILFILLINQIALGSQSPENNFETKNVIFDLDGVLVETNQFESMKFLGLHNILTYSIFNLSIPNKEFFFEEFSKSRITQKKTLLHNTMARKCQQFLMPGLQEK